MSRFRDLGADDLEDVVVSDGVVLMWRVNDDTGERRMMRAGTRMVKRWGGGFGYR